MEKRNKNMVRIKNNTGVKAGIAHGADGRGGG